MARLILLTFILLFSVGAQASKDCVVLLHGLARTEKAMNKLEDALLKEGYTVINYGYPSTKFNIETLADDHIPLAIAQCDESPKINFVTHSMGGIILRQYLEANEINKLNRVVMLGPPNKGSQVVDNLKNVPGFRLINGPAGVQLGTEETDIPASLGAAKGEVGVIAGTKTINLILSLYLPNPDDGKVSVENTKLDGMKEHITVNVSHPFLMKDDEVIGYVINFLERGEFGDANK